MVSSQQDRWVSQRTASDGAGQPISRVPQPSVGSRNCVWRSLQLQRRSVRIAELPADALSNRIEQMGAPCTRMHEMTHVDCVAAVGASCAGLNARRMSIAAPREDRHTKTCLQGCQLAIYCIRPAQSCRQAKATYQQRQAITEAMCTCSDER